jgi:hypothetical protein
VTPKSDAWNQRWRQQAPGFKTTVCFTKAGLKVHWAPHTTALPGATRCYCTSQACLCPEYHPKIRPVPLSSKTHCPATMYQLRHSAAATHLAHWLWVCGAGGEVAVQVQPPIQATPAVVAGSSVGQAGRHQRHPLHACYEGREGRGVATRSQCPRTTHSKVNTGFLAGTSQAMHSSRQREWR